MLRKVAVGLAVSVLAEAKYNLILHARRANYGAQ